MLFRKLLHGLMAMLFLFANNCNLVRAAEGGMKYEGVSIAGAEWGAGEFPGINNYHYIFPNAGEIDYFKAKGMNIIRVPIMWERIQPTANGPLDPAYLGLLDQVVDYATAKGMWTVVELHNNGSYYHTTVGVPGGVPNSVFADLWSKLAMHYKNNPKAQLSLMGEPIGATMTAQSWLVSTQEAINAVRATGNTSLIIVSAPFWNHARNFVELVGSEMIKVQDPANNFTYEVHEYFNYDGSGTTTDTVSAAEAVATMVNFTAWLRQNHRTGFLGEIGVPATPGGLEDLDAVLKYLYANKDVWDGYTYWSAGPWWQGYVFGVEPVNGQDTPQMQVLIANLKVNTVPDPTPTPEPDPTPTPTPTPTPDPTLTPGTPPGPSHGHPARPERVPPARSKPTPVPRPVRLPSVQAPKPLIESIAQPIPQPTNTTTATPKGASPKIAAPKPSVQTAPVRSIKTAPYVPPQIQFRLPPPLMLLLFGTTGEED